MADSLNPNPDTSPQGADPDKVQMFNIPATSEIVELEKDTIRSLHKLASILERMRLSEYIAMMQQPRRMIFLNFIAGLSRGFGFVLGMTVLVGLALFVLRELVDLPLIGKYIARIVDIVRQELNNRPPGGF